MKKEVEDEVQHVTGMMTRREEPGDTDQVINGRIKITLYLGTGARRRENLRIMNGCENAEELKRKLGILRVWRVEIKHEPREDRVAGDGYCGYTAMTQIINNTDRKYDLRKRVDRVEVGMTIRNIINGGKGLVRNGYQRFNASELNAKERAEMAYRKLMVDEQHFLAYKGLEAEYWMRGMLVD